MNDAAQRYLKEVNRQIACPASIKKPFMRRMKNEVLGFCDEHDELDIGVLSEQFGDPKEVAKDFQTELGEQAVDYCIRTRRKLLLIILGVILIAVIATLAIGIRISSLKKEIPEEDFIASITYEEDSDNGVFQSPQKETIFDGREQEDAS